MKTTYAPYICEIVDEIMSVGGSLNDVMQVLRINQKTLDDWRNKYPKFDETIKEGLALSAKYNSLVKEGTLEMKTKDKGKEKSSADKTVNAATKTATEFCSDNVNMTLLSIISAFNHAHASDSFQPDINTLYNQLKTQMAGMSEGNNVVEITFLTQAKTLEMIFHSLICKSFATNNFEYFRYRMDLALRAQNQCRKTLLALEAVRHPPQKQIVGQQNIALNQQVNNGTADTTPTKPSIKVKSENELLETKNEQRLDERAPGTTGKINPSMETVAISRSKDSRR